MYVYIAISYINLNAMCLDQISCALCFHTYTFYEFQRKTATFFIPSKKYRNGIFLHEATSFEIQFLSEYFQIHAPNLRSTYFQTSIFFKSINLEKRIHSAKMALLNPCMKIKHFLAKRLLLRHYESAIYKKNLEACLMGIISLQRSPQFFKQSQ